MADYLATFYTHLAALKTQRALNGAGITCRLSPVPRQVSSSCGICVKYTGENPCEALMDTDLEAVYEVSENGYTELLRRG